MNLERYMLDVHYRTRIMTIIQITDIMNNHNERFRRPLIHQNPMSNRYREVI